MIHTTGESKSMIENFVQIISEESSLPQDKIKTLAESTFSNNPIIRDSTIKELFQLISPKIRKENPKIRNAIKVFIET